MKQHYLYSLQGTEAGYERSKSMIVRDPRSEFFGGVADWDLLVDNAGAIGRITTLACLYFCNQSRYYQDASLLDEIKMQAESVISRIHENGTSDMLASNFYTPATFETNYYVKGYKVFLKYTDHSPNQQEALNIMTKLLECLAKGLINGGFHTPNHRWVESAALYSCYNLLGWEELKHKADLYLAEGIDIDEYGEFTERSPGIYNEVNDNALFIIAEESGREELFDCVRKNLSLLYHYIDADNSVFTQNSRRNDKGEVSINVKFYPTNYYSILLRCAYQFNNMEYVAFADKLVKDCLAGGRGVPGDLALFLLKPELQDWEPDFSNVKFPVQYDAFYPISNIWRYRDGDVSYSLLAQNPNFLFIKNQNIIVYVRMCASFFAVAQFCPSELTKTDDGYQMTFTAHGEYMLPLETPPPSSDWSEIDHSKRGIVNKVDLVYTLSITKIQDGLRLHIKTSGCEHVPFKLEFVVSCGNAVATSDMMTSSSAGNFMAVKQGDVRIESPSGSEILLKNMFARHSYHKSMRGSLSPAEDGYTIYCTDYSNVDRTVDILCQKRAGAHLD